jgi:hypothetical protein
MRDPRLENVVTARGSYPTLEGIAGKTMVILNNEWTSMNEIVDYLTKALKARYGLAKVVSFRVPTGLAADDSVIREAARVGDFALVGLAN